MVTEKISNVFGDRDVFVEQAVHDVRRQVTKSCKFLLAHPIDTLHLLSENNARVNILLIEFAHLAFSFLGNPCSMSYMNVS